MFTMVLKDWPDFHSVGFRTRHSLKIRIVPGELGIVCPPMFTPQAGHKRLLLLAATLCRGKRRS